jgi:phenol hydroxylase P1 protein
MGLAAGYPGAGKAVRQPGAAAAAPCGLGSNINNSYIAAYSYGIAISQAAAYACMDQLGIAQFITRLAISLDEIDALAEAKQAWLEAPVWQGLRHYIEDQMVDGRLVRALRGPELRPRRPALSAHLRQAQ